MSYELRKPITENERVDFIVQYNHNKGLKIEETEMFLFALLPDEIMGEKEIEIGEQVLIIPYPVIDPDYEVKQAQKREDEFKKAFFYTSLGYIRRNVTMSDGTHKDFLSDLLPTIAMAINLNTPVTVLAYDEPNFHEDITDWTVYQHEKFVTGEFVQECFARLQADFAG